MRRNIKQQRSSQQANGQAANITEKKLRWMPVKKDKPNKRPHKTSRQQGPQRAAAAAEGEDKNTKRQRKKPGKGHAVDPVHEVGEVHKPSTSQQQYRSFDWKGYGLAQNAPMGRCHHHNAGNPDELGQKARGNRQAFNIINAANNGQQDCTQHQKHQLL